MVIWLNYTSTLNWLFLVKNPTQSASCSFSTYIFDSCFFYVSFYNIANMSSVWYELLDCWAWGLFGLLRTFVGFIEPIVEGYWFIEFKLINEFPLGIKGFMFGFKFWSLFFWYLIWLDVFGNARINLSLSIRIATSDFFSPNSFYFLFFNPSLALMAISKVWYSTLTWILGPGN